MGSDWMDGMVRGSFNVLQLLCVECWNCLSGFGGKAWHCVARESPNGMTARCEPYWTWMPFCARSEGSEILHN